MANNNAKLPMNDLMAQAGLVKAPKKVNDCNLKADIKRFLRIIDEQDAVNRYQWYNIPGGITSQELERRLYYKGQLCFFYRKELNKFYFMPYALDGSLDFYGRFNYIHPVPFTEGDEGKKQKAYLSTLKLNCQYGILQPYENLLGDTIFKSTVLLHDYTKQASQTIIPRQQVNDAIIDAMADIIPLRRTNRFASSGIAGLRVQDDDSADEVKDANDSVKEAGLSSDIYVPIVGSVDFQQLTGAGGLQSQSYFQTLQALDSLRLSSYGIESGGLYEKKAHILQSELDAINNNVSLINADGLSIRQNFCHIVNSIWGLGIWCEPSDAARGKDQDHLGATLLPNQGSQAAGGEENNDDNQ